MLRAGAHRVAPRTRNAQVLGSIPSASSNQIKELRCRVVLPETPILQFSYSSVLARGEDFALRAILGYSQARVFLSRSPHARPVAFRARPPSFPAYRSSATRPRRNNARMHA